MEDTLKLMEDAEMFADVRAYDAAKVRLDEGGDELITLASSERRLKGEVPAPHLAGLPEPYPGATREESESVTRPDRGN
jgi:hypothetical protein